MIICDWNLATRYLNQVLLSFSIAAFLIFSLTPSALCQPAMADRSSQAFFKLGVTKMQSHNYQGAVTDFTQAIQSNSNLASAYSNRCLAYIELGDYFQALEDCTQTLQRNPTNLEAYVNRGLAYYRLGKYQQAIADYNQLLQLKPYDFRGYYNRGLAWFALGKYEQAIANYNQSLSQIPPVARPQLATIHNDRGLAHLMLANTKAALTDFTQAIRFDDSDARAYYNRGCAYYQVGDNLKAVRDFTFVLQLTPDNANVYMNRGLISYQIGNQSAGLTDLQEAAKCFYKQGAITAYQQTLNLMRQLQSPNLAIG